MGKGLLEKLVGRPMKGMYVTQEYVLRQSGI